LHLCVFEFGLDGVNLRLLDLLSRVPALLLHLLIDVDLHRERAVERASEGLMNTAAGTFDGAVHIEVARAFFKQEHILH
jgi:hypothetical protein